MALISTSGISALQIIKSDHLLRIINALNGVVSNDIIISGSLQVVESITGSLFGTSSYSTQAVSASFATTASFVTTLNQDVAIQKTGTGVSLSLTAQSAGGTEIRLLPNSTAGFAIINVGNSTQPLDFQMNSANVMRITQAGNVGIGTTIPSAKLDVNGSTKLNGNTTITGSLITSGSITSTFGFIKPNSDNQVLLANGTTSTNGTLFKTGSGYQTAGTTVQYYSTPISSSMFINNDILLINSVTNTTITSVAQVTTEYYINSTNSMSGANRIALYNGPLGSLYYPMDRTFWVSGGNFISKNANASISTSTSNSNSSVSSTPIPSPIFYLIIQITTTSTDSARLGTVTVQKI